MDLCSFEMNLSSASPTTALLLAIVLMIAVVAPLMALTLSRLSRAVRGKPMHRIHVVALWLGLSVFSVSVGLVQLNARRYHHPKSSSRIMVGMCERLKSFAADQRHTSPDAYPFPGGPGYTYNSQLGVGHGPDCAWAPRGGESGSVSQMPEALIETFRLHTDDHTYHQIVYETGEGTGDEASVTVTLLADFDESSPECHSHRMTMSIDPLTGRLIVSHHELAHEFE